MPDSPEVAPPWAEAEPVSPELASPEAARVALPERDSAEPLVPPLVWLVAVEFPELPPVAVVDGFEVASPLSPEMASALPLAPLVAGSTDGSDEGSAVAPKDSLTLCGLAVAEPDPPDAFEEWLAAEAPPVDPVFPEVV